MSKYLSPKEIQALFSIGKTTTYKLLNEYAKQGEVITIGTRTKRVNEELFTEFLKKRKP